MKGRCRSFAPGGEDLLDGIDLSDTGVQVRVSLEVFSAGSEEGEEEGRWGISEEAEERSLCRWGSEQATPFLPDIAVLDVLELLCGERDEISLSEKKVSPCVRMLK